MRETCLNGHWNLYGFFFNFPYDFLSPDLVSRDRLNTSMHAYSKAIFFVNKQLRQIKNGPTSTEPFYLENTLNLAVS